MTHNGHRFLTISGLVLAQVGLVASALAVWFFAGLTFFGEPLHRDSYVHMALGFGLAAVLLLLILVPANLLRAGVAVQVVSALLALLCGAGVLLALQEAATASRANGGEEWWWAPEFFTILPTTWPALLLLLATPWLRGRSSRSPR